jgi:hypothetical protein
MAALSKDAIERIRVAILVAISGNSPKRRELEGPKIKGFSHE